MENSQPVKRQLGELIGRRVQFFQGLSPNGEYLPRDVVREELEICQQKAGSDIMVNSEDVAAVSFVEGDKTERHESIPEEVIMGVLEHTNMSKDVVREVQEICQQAAGSEIMENSEDAAAVSFVEGDKTEQHVDVLVDLTDEHMSDSSQYTQTIHDMSEPDIIVTPGVNQPCKYVYHTEVKDQQKDVFPETALHVEHGKHPQLGRGKAASIAGHIPLPQHWRPTNEEMFLMAVELKPSDKEYKLVARQFNAGVNHQYCIIKMERIQNRTLHLQYLMRKHEMLTKHKNKDVERHLWHGTTGDSVTSINIHGFRQSYRSVLPYGQGTYFAVSSGYCADDGCSRPNDKGHKHMYYAAVLTGRHTKGEAEMKVLPPRDPANPSMLYDSVVDDINNPTMYVVFNDVQAYPKYLITFKSTSSATSIATHINLPQPGSSMTDEQCLMKVQDEPSDIEYNPFERIRERFRSQRFMNGNQSIEVERHLWHDTSGDSTTSVNVQGFSRSCGSEFTDGLEADVTGIKTPLHEGVTEEKVDRILQQIPDNISKEVARDVLNICEQQANKSVRGNSQEYAAVSFVTGDITQQHVDAIATMTVAKPDVGSAEGEESGIFVTDGGDLPCQRVYNVLNQTLPLTEQRLRHLTDGVLRKAEHDGISSIAFQPTGYGMDSLPKAVLAEAILDTALNHVCDSLDEIVVCADKGEVDTIKAFTAEIDKRPQLGKGKELGSTFTVTIVKGDIVHQDVDVIVNSTSSSLGLATGQLSAAIYIAAGHSIQEECRVKYPTGVKTEEIAETSGGRLPSGRIYHTSLGVWSEQNYRAFFLKCLTKASSSKLKSIAFPLIGTGILAYPCDEVAKCIFKSFDQFKTGNPDTSLCEARIVVYPKDKANLEIFEGATPTEAAADVRPVYSTTSEFTLQTAVGMAWHIKLPAHWSPMTEDQFVSEVQLEPEDKEYKLVARQFNTGVKNRYTIVEIKRIQNRTLYLQYVMLLHQMAKENLGMDVERHLWHGTKEDVVTSINLHGFSRRYVTVHRFGKGTYFAVNTSYSARDLYSPPNEDGTKHVYYASVLTGHFTKGKVDMVAPPSRGLEDPNVLYDSLVDNVYNPSMYVVFNDVQAYPKYLITLRE